MRAAKLLAALVVAIVVLVAPAAGTAADTPPWRAVGNLNDALFAAQTDLIVDGPDAAAAQVRDARATLSALGASLPEDDADEVVEDVGRVLDDALLAARHDDAERLAAARGALRALLFGVSFEVTLDAVDRGDAKTAAQWLLVREFRTATRFTRPGADATLAAARLGSGTLARGAAHKQVAKDLLDAYQARLRELLDDARRGADRDFPARRAEAAAQAAGYFRILRDRYMDDRGLDATRKALDAFAALSETAHDGGPPFTAALEEAAATLDGFTAAPLTADESARRAQQLLRFLALVPVEYGRGVSGTKVTKDFEIQEAVAFQKAAAAAFADLENALNERDPVQAAQAEAAIAQLGKYVDGATKTPDRVATHEQVETSEERGRKALEAVMPAEWKQKTDESDYDLIDITFDRMEAAVGAGQYKQAEAARIEGYAFFEFGPERRLKSFDPGLALDIEGLIWFGNSDFKGLAELIGKRAPRREIHATRLELDKKLADAAATLGDGASRATVVTNSAIIVFREGLEAVLILAALTASMVGVRRRLRRPVMIGAAGGLAVSLVTWVLAQTLIRSLEQYGEKLEAIVGIIAIGVLLLITNWFFHKVYWSEWIGRFHRTRKRIEKSSFVGAQALGLGLLGLTSVYREGFETVLFLQSLQLSTDTATVLEGAGLGLFLTFLVAIATFALQRKLPYKKMLIVTGLFIAVVLVVMTGQTARTLQGTGWLSITPIDVDLPYWTGLWLGIFPTVETIGLQIAAFVFVVGSYVLAQEVRVKRPQRRAAKKRADSEAAADAAQRVAEPTSSG